MEKKISKSFRAIFASLYPNFDENEIQNSEEYFNFILKSYPDKSEIIQLKAFFVIFSLGLRKLFIKDKNIPKFINNLQSSNISIFRKLGSGMTALFGLSTARSLNGEGSVYKHFDYPIYNNAKIEKKFIQVPESIEVAVIGSGSGGGVAANLLNENYEVGIFEKGSYANRETNNETFGYHNFYETYAMQQTRGYKVLLLAGSSVGGGTSINWTTSLRTPDNILNEWDSLTGQNNYFNSSNFKSSMDFICQQLNVSEANNKIPQKEIKLAEGLSQSQISYKIIPRNTSNDQCLESGFSTFGHSDESINSSYQTWFPEDKFNSQNVYSNTSVKYLTISKGRATHINVEKNGKVQQIAVDKVVLAAGSLNTPKILLNSGYKNKHLGQHLKLHPVSGVAGKFSEEQKPWAGTMQGIYSDDYLFMKDNYGYLLEGLPMHPSLFFPFFPNNNDNFEDFIKSYNYWSGSIVLTSDKSSGSIINKNPQHLWDYNLNDFDHSNLLHGLENLVRANYLAGAEEIMVAASPTMHWKKSSNVNIEDFINKIRAIKNEPFRILLGSAHQMGTARINPNPELGVVDLDGKVHGLENVYIVDASTFPRCSGVNPMISIQSMSHFLMSKI
ncbi:MAG: GMC family oxidoreductase [Candidatus Actinomarina sp.]|nr:GMC family oxidoreductase [Candidatus Actinomarina sp.]MBL6763108.1 GMC family oxidoreductase [Candidatus Actinomarina sp.]MDA2946782.1 GMC family oxidoreductase N-terminal domain-containing protein [Actinomycetota bacterium]MDA3008330.1 GMC family oxidoreductase N-terminal domain-containing protein [Actinomycetota bacterium]MDA3037197.1 GMC family oxidoreductase N-terminal domain-containing protein [Actinomycetota bacterium]